MLEEEIPIEPVKAKETRTRKSKPKTDTVDDTPVTCATETGAVKPEPGAVVFGEAETSLFQVNVTKKEILRK